MNIRRSIHLALWALLLAAPVQAAAILSPTDVINNTMGTFPCCSYTDDSIVNQSGLLTPFTSGVTDFDAYIAGSPQHTVEAFCCEWFSPDGVMSGLMTFGVGAVYLVDR